MASLRQFIASRNTRAHAEHAAAERVERRDPARCAAQVRAWLDRPSLTSEDLTVWNRGPRAVAAEVARVFPDAARVLGPAVLTAAAGPDVPGCCRWGRASAHARVHELPKPRFTTDLVPLLGRPCDDCTTRWRAETRARVNAGRPTRPSTSDARARRSAAATGVLKRFHDVDKCVTCDEAVRLKLTPSDVPTHPRMYALPPHLQSLLASAARVRHATRTPTTHRAHCACEKCVNRDVSRYYRTGSWR